MWRLKSKIKFCLKALGLNVKARFLQKYMINEIAHVQTKIKLRQAIQKQSFFFKSVILLIQEQ